MAIKTRFQLKYDTEENWNKALNFIPLRGEVIIYAADDLTPFPRIKVGDGTTPVVDLPFASSGNASTEVVLQHKLTFGANQQYVFDGSEDVTVPVYTGVLT